jgi:conserved hypothetical protein, ribA/ribD-fused
MKYDLNWIKSTFEKEEKLKYLFYWGHRPMKDGSIGKSCLSQWWESEFEVEHKKYKTSEHWMMAKKAELFGDQEILEKIYQARTPGEAKKLGRKVRNFDPEVWEENRYEIVKKGNYHKFSQNESLKNFLLNTKKRILVEASPVDSIWGIGLASDADKIENPNTWRGLNLLGFAQMEVRDMLSEEAK